MEPEVIFFDLNITVSLQEKDKTDEDKIEIIEIAAKTQDKEFRKYILPTCPITRRAILVMYSVSKCRFRFGFG